MLIVRCLLSAVCCVLLCVGRCCLFVICGLPVDAWWLLFVVVCCSSVFVVGRSLAVCIGCCWLLFAVCKNCLLIDVRLRFVVCCVVFGVCCLVVAVVCCLAVIDR